MNTSANLGVATQLEEIQANLGTLANKLKTTKEFSTIALPNNWQAKVIRALIEGKEPEKDELKKLLNIIRGQEGFSKIESAIFGFRNRINALLEGKPEIDRQLLDSVRIALDNVSEEGAVANIRESTSESIATENTGVCFLKPESLNIENPLKAVELMLGIFEYYGIKISGMFAANGKALEKIMPAHYGVINDRSKNSSEMSSEDKRKVLQALGLSSENECIFMGGHEYMVKMGKTPEEVNKVWEEGQSKKIKDGFYVRLLDESKNIDGKQVVLVNGFHPYQLEHFVNKDSKILVMQLHFDLPWALVREFIIGSTDPKKAFDSSIRALFAKRAEALGFPKGTFNMGNNGLHVSAGPFEGFLEKNNFYSLIAEQLESIQTAFEKALIGAGVNLGEFKELVETNPQFKKRIIDGTEDMNTPDAVQFIVEHILGEKKRLLLIRPLSVSDVDNQND